MEGTIEGQDQQQQQQQPQIDLSALGDQVKQQMEAGFSQFYQNLAEQVRQAQIQQQQQAQLQQQQQQFQQDEMGRIITPYVQPIAQATALRNQMTEDYVQFYLQNPEAVAKQTEIEAKFQELIGRGVALPRRDIWAWFAGQEALQKRREEAAQRAAEGVTLQGGSPPRQYQQPAKDPWTLTDAELDEALKGVAF